MKSQQHGFTLWELLVTLLVAGILLGIGVPNVIEMQRNSVMSAAANDLVTAALMARAEAVKRQVPTALCLSTNPLATTPTCSPAAVADSLGTLGVIVWVDDDGDGVPETTDGNAVVNVNEVILSRFAVRPLPLQLSTNCGYVSYAPTGFPRAVTGLCFPFAATPITFLYCDDRGRRLAAGSLSSARIITIDRLGRGQAFQDETIVNGQIATSTGTCA
jgi:type IV fimbrial biogenesis protein FimT